jgi:REP element-mobilizing transposase RayT
MFVTIDTANRQSLFGVIGASGIRLSPAGEMLDEIWNRVPETFSSVALDEYIVMPDHTHALLMMGLSSPSVPLGQVVRWLKSTAVEAYRHGVIHQGWEPYDGKMWHRNFHDRVLRDGELDVRRLYIRANPRRRWERMLAEADGPHAIWSAQPES